MNIRRLSWAGVSIEDGETTLYIDPLFKVPANQSDPYTARIGNEVEPLISAGGIPAPQAILLTHTHPDHFDHISIKELYGEEISLFLPEESVSFAKKLGFTNVHGASVGQSFHVGNTKVTATYALDGFGSPQVAWIVEASGKRIIHCGDTMWHGYWWKIEALYGPIDAACLPINGPILEVLGLKRQSSLPAAMTPEEAAEAGHILGVKTIVPIHYHTFHNPPYYTETREPLERLMVKAEEREMNVSVLRTNEILSISI